MEPSPRGSCSRQQTPSSSQCKYPNARQRSANITTPANANVPTTIPTSMQYRMLHAQSSSDEDEEAEPRAMERVNATTKRASALTSRSFESSSDDSESPLAKKSARTTLARAQQEMASEVAQTTAHEQAPSAAGSSATERMALVHETMRLKEESEAELRSQLRSQVELRHKAEDSLRAEFDSERLQMQEQLERLRARHTALTENLSSSEAANTALCDELADLREQLTEALAAKERLRESLASQSVECASRVAHVERDALGELARQQEEFDVILEARLQQQADAARRVQAKAGGGSDGRRRCHRTRKGLGSGGGHGGRNSVQCGAARDGAAARREATPGTGVLPGARGAAPYDAAAALPPRGRRATQAARSARRAAEPAAQGDIAA